MGNLNKSDKHEVNSASNKKKGNKTRTRLYLSNKTEEEKEVKRKKKKKEKKERKTDRTNCRFAGYVTHIN